MTTAIGRRQRPRTVQPCRLDMLQATIEPRLSPFTDLAREGLDLGTVVARGIGLFTAVSRLLERFGSTT
jgi:hypothetical protein